MSKTKEERSLRVKKSTPGFYHEYIIKRSYLALPSADDTRREPAAEVEYLELVTGREESVEYEEYPVGLDDSVGLE